MNLLGILDFIQAGFSFNVANKEAIEFFKNKGLKLTFSYRDMAAQEHSKALTVAKMLDMDMLQDVQDSLRHAIAKGWTYQQWADRIVPIMQANGWWGRKAMVDPVTGKTIIAQLGSPHRLKTIFRTNMQQAYSVGRWQQVMDTAKERPYLRYDAIDDQRTRAEHRRWNGTILPFDHPFWQTHYPPCGYNCRCSVTQFSQADIEAKGYQITDKPDLSTDGIDKGFDSNPGADHLSRLQDIAREKAARIKDEGLRKAALDALDEMKNSVKSPTTSTVVNNRMGIKDSRLKAKVVTEVDEKQALAYWLKGEQQEYEHVVKGLKSDPEIVTRSQELGLTTNEQVAIYYYTGFGSKSLNAMLNNDAPFDKYLGRAAILLKQALDKIPDYQGTVVRRVESSASLLETHIPGEIITYYGFTSTTYGTEDIFGNRPIRLVIDCLTGKDIHWLSYGKGFADAEEFEALISPPTQFIVIDRTDKGTYIEIMLMEVRK